jgi:hypothetical protein
VVPGRGFEPRSASARGGGGIRTASGVTDSAGNVYAEVAHGIDSLAAEQAAWQANGIDVFFDGCMADRAEQGEA